MNSTLYNAKSSNYYTYIDGVHIYVDHVNQRIKILDYMSISKEAIEKIIELSQKEGVGKIISNCRIMLLKQFRSSGFVSEGIINGFFQGEDAYCVSYFIDNERQLEPKREEEDYIIRQCGDKSIRLSQQEEHEYMLRNAEVGDIPQMIKLFSAVFETYPSPVFNMEYLEKVMSEHGLFKVVEAEGRIISIASADIDIKNLNAEITDCATYLEYRGKGLLQKLIQNLEAELKDRGLLTAYSLSRATNPGINKALSRMGYKYSGRLINNCYICGGFEDMNIWVKSLK